MTFLPSLCLYCPSTQICERDHEWLLLLSLKSKTFYHAVLKVRLVRRGKCTPRCGQDEGHKNHLDPLTYIDFESVALVSLTLVVWLVKLSALTLN